MHDSTGWNLLLNVFFFFFNTSCLTVVQTCIHIECDVILLIDRLFSFKAICCLLVDRFSGPIYAKGEHLVLCFMHLFTLG